MLLIPGFGGTQVDATQADFSEWLTRRGIDPQKIESDPVADSADDLIQSLENVGYRRSATVALPQTLWIGNWDWRVPVAERDAGAANGVLSGGSSPRLIDWHGSPTVAALGLNDDGRKHAYAANFPEFGFTDRAAKNGKEL